MQTRTHLHNAPSDIILDFLMKLEHCVRTSNMLSGITQAWQLAIPTVFQKRLLMLQIQAALIAV